jgi:thiol:disulfide interchange protein DsbC
VFTDIDCGYCRKLHAQIGEYMKEGISVEYLFFPRAGLNSESYTKAVNVWCAPTGARRSPTAKLDRPVAKKTLRQPDRRGLRARPHRVGVDGTPAIYASDGTQLGGYLPPGPDAGAPAEGLRQAVAAELRRSGPGPRARHGMQSPTPATGPWRGFR